ncbi:hypothetical protein LguiB_018292 [Lonicera macranthoides]
MDCFCSTNMQQKLTKTATNSQQYKPDFYAAKTATIETNFLSNRNRFGSNISDSMAAIKTLHNTFTQKQINHRFSSIKQQKEVKKD